MVEFERLSKCQKLLIVAALSGLLLSAPALEAALKPPPPNAEEAADENRLRAARTCQWHIKEYSLVPSSVRYDTSSTRAGPTPNRQWDVQGEMSAATPEGRARFDYRCIVGFDGRSVIGFPRLVRQ